MFRRIFDQIKSAHPPRLKDLDVSCGDFHHEVVGEASYLTTLQKVLQTYGRTIRVRVICEPTNPHDANAVRIATLGGETVGYLPREVAEVLCPYLTVLEKAGNRLVCNGDLHGGEGAKRNIGVWIDLHHTDELVKLAGRSA